MGETKKAEEEEAAKESGEKPKTAAAEEDPKKTSAAAEEDANAKKGEKKDGDGGTDPPPPPEEVVMRVYMHCEGCARKVRRSLKGFQGVEEVRTDCRTQRVVVKGKKAAEDPMQVVERVQRKSGRKVELLSPIPPPKPEKKEEDTKKKEEEEKKPKPEEKKEEPPVMVVVLKVHMHCEACAQEMKKRILKMKGVETVDPELKASEVTVKGVIDGEKLVEYVYKRTGKHAVVVKSEPLNKKPEADNKPTDNDKKSPDENAGEKDDDGKSPAAATGDGEEGNRDGGAAAAKLVEMKRNELYYYYPRHNVEYAYPPQIFSDENPNACAVM